MTPNSDPRTLAETYFDSWKNKDFDTLRSVLADDATFRGPLGSAGTGDECLQGLQSTVAPPAPTVNWSHIEGGRISRIRVTFDPRAIVAG